MSSLICPAFCLSVACRRNRPVKRKLTSEKATPRRDFAERFLPTGVSRRARNSERTRTTTKEPPRSDRAPSPARGPLRPSVFPSDEWRHRPCLPGQETARRRRGRTDPALSRGTAGRQAGSQPAPVFVSVAGPTATQRWRNGRRSRAPTRRTPTPRRPPSRRRDKA